MSRRKARRHFLKWLRWINRNPECLRQPAGFRRASNRRALHDSKTHSEQNVWSST